MLKRWIVVAALLAPVAASADTDYATTVRILVHALFDEAYAAQTQNPYERIAGHVDSLNSFLASAGVELSLTAVEPIAVDAQSACVGEESLFAELRRIGSASGGILIGFSAVSADGSVLGCAMQDSWGRRDAVAVIRDPPYATAPLGATEDLEYHHAMILHAHEVGHVLGGLHGLAWPQGELEGTTGTIMYPTIQLNFPRYSGTRADGECVLFGNVCRIANFVEAVQNGTAEARDREYPVFDCAVDAETCVWPPTTP